jgi:REP element-mobilizing transposase RayT
VIVGHHLVWTAYGWWLPTDPRGSSSREIRVEVIGKLGELHYGRKAVQPPSSKIRAFYQKASTVLKHPLLRFSEGDVAVLAASFAETIRERRYTCYACAIMPDHVHLLIRRHREMGHEMIAAFQADSGAAMIAKHRRGEDHHVWGGPGYAVYQDSREDMERVVRYVEENPTKAGLPEQHWDFVQTYDGWVPWARR